MILKHAETQCAKQGIQFGCNKISIRYQFGLDHLFGINSGIFPKLPKNIDGGLDRNKKTQKK